MILNIKDLATRKFVAENKGLFEKVNEEYAFSSSMRQRKYTQLNYKLILDQIVEFASGYIEYKEKDSSKYKGQVLSSARSFYNSMFTDDKKYRRTLYIADMKDSYEQFLYGTKKLQDFLEKNLERSKADPEFHQLLIMTDNQYRKLSRVCKDDMRIYLWLSTEEQVSIPTQLRLDYADASTPVIHPKKIKASDVKNAEEAED